MTGRHHPMALGTSAISDTMTFTLRTPMRLASTARLAGSAPLAIAPLRLIAET
jgi:hypothetical protein